MSVELYRNGVIAVGLSMMVLLFVLGDWAIEPLDVAFFMALIILSAWMVVPMRHGSLSFNLAVGLPVYILFGAVPAAWIMALGHLIGNGLVRRRPLPVALFNFSQYGISLMLPAWLAGVIAGDVAAFPSTTWIPHLAVMVTLYLVVNNALVRIYFILGGSKFSPAAFWRDHLRWNVMNHLVSCGLGILTAFAFLEMDHLGTLLVFIPLMTVAYLFSLLLKLDMASQEMEVLYRCSRDLSGALEVERVFHLIGESIGRLVQHDAMILFLYDEKEEVLSVAMADGINCTPDCSIALGAGIVGRVAASQREELVQDVESDARLHPCPEAVDKPRSLIVAPLVAEDNLVGVLAVGRFSTGGFLQKHLQPVAIMASQMAAAIQGAMLYERTERLAITDALTGLYNYRHFHLRLSEEIRKARRTGSTVALLYIDIDDFKAVNDSHGHLVGDEVLREVAAILQEHLRASDTAARYGGEEFVVILPGAGPEEAAAIATRLEEGVARHRFGDFRGGKVLQVTISVGHAVFPLGVNTEIELINAADVNMYAKKHSERDRG